MGLTVVEILTKNRYSHLCHINGAGNHLPILTSLPRGQPGGNSTYGIVPSALSGPYGAVRVSLDSVP
jgi:hypothetical protein